MSRSARKQKNNESASLLKEQELFLSQLKQFENTHNEKVANDEEDFLKQLESVLASQNQSQNGKNQSQNGKNKSKVAQPKVYDHKTSELKSLNHKEAEVKAATTTATANRFTDNKPVVNNFVDNKIVDDNASLNEILKQLQEEATGDNRKQEKSNNNLNLEDLLSKLNMISEGEDANEFVQDIGKDLLKGLIVSTTDYNNKIVERVKFVNRLLEKLKHLIDREELNLIEFLLLLFALNTLKGKTEEQAKEDGFYTVAVKFLLWTLKRCNDE